MTSTLRSKLVPNPISRLDVRAMHRREAALRDLADSMLYSSDRAFEGFLSYEDRVLLSVKRARALVMAYGR